MYHLFRRHAREWLSGADRITPAYRSIDPFDPSLHACGKCGENLSSIITAEGGYRCESCHAAERVPPPIPGGITTDYWEQLRECNYRGTK